MGMAQGKDEKRDDIPIQPTLYGYDHPAVPHLIDGPGCM